MEKYVGPEDILDTVELMKNPPLRRARNVQINFRVSAQEKCWLEEMAMEKGMMVSQYLRFVVFGGRLER